MRSSSVPTECQPAPQQIAEAGFRRISHGENATMTITKLDTWGNGKAPPADLTQWDDYFIVNEGAGLYSAWSFDGDRKESAIEAARKIMKPGEVAMMDGMTVTIGPPPEDFWIVVDGKTVPNPEYRECIAY
jgi:hypothetical protein